MSNSSLNISYFFCFVLSYREEPKIPFKYNERNKNTFLPPLGFRIPFIHIYGSILPFHLTIFLRVMVHPFISDVVAFNWLEIKLTKKIIISPNQIWIQLNFNGQITEITYF